MRSQTRARGKKSPRWAPPVVPAIAIPGLDRELDHRLDYEEVPRPAVEAEPVVAPAAPLGPVERDGEGRAIDWSNPDAMRKGSPHVVILWFVIPLVAILLYGIFVR